MKTKPTLIFLSSALALSSLACDRSAELEPAKTAAQPPEMDDAVTASQQGIEVVAQVDEWPGDANIEDEVTPLRVIIRNQSDQPVQIRYSDFKLTAPDGKSYSAIPPRNVTGVVQEQDYIRPGFGYTGFYTAPYYGTYYSGIDPYDGPFEYDAGYYDTYYGYWDNTTALPTLDMIARALPEGVLEVGGNLDGYIYFEEVQKDEGTSITLHADLQAANGKQRIASFQMPFVVD